MDDLVVKQKTIDDYKKNSIKHFKCEKCGCLFAFPEHQKSGHMCPFCSIELKSSPSPSIDMEDQSIKRINVVTIKRDGKIVEVKELNDEEFTKITNKGTVYNSCNVITELEILILSKIESCAISKILMTIINDTLKDESVSDLNIKFNKLILNTDTEKYVNKDDAFFPQILFIEKSKENQEITHLSIKNFNKEYLIGMILKLKSEKSIRCKHEIN